MSSAGETRLDGRVALEPPPDALRIEDVLFRPGAKYLLSLFLLPEVERTPALRQAADWLGMADAFVAAELEVDPGASVTEKWLTLLDWCASRFTSIFQRQELSALVAALREGARKADESFKSVPIDDLWKSMAVELSRILEESQNSVVDSDRAEASSGEKGPNAATLRGRRWTDLRSRLAVVLNGLVASSRDAVKGLPRKPRLGVFTEDAFAFIAGELDDREKAGMVVLSGRSGIGKSELALSYAASKLEELRYRFVFWLRADNAFNLERDFQAMAELLLGHGGEPAYLRRGALSELESLSGGWLLIFDSVTDPGLLLPYVPRNPYGHGICTFTTERPTESSFTMEDSIPDATEQWGRYLNVDPIQIETQTQLAPNATAALGLELEQSALSLLTQLVELGAGTHPAVLLGYLPAWNQNDMNRLDELGLVTQSTLEHAKYFKVSRQGRDRLGAENTSTNPPVPPPTEIVLQAFRKLFRALPSEEAFDLTPLAEKIARVIAPLGQERTPSMNDEPLDAVELLARAAPCHLALGRVRATRTCMTRVEEIFDDSAWRSQIRERLWAVDSEEESQETTAIKRMQELVGFLRRAEYLDGAEKLFDLLQRVLLDNGSGVAWPSTTDTNDPNETVAALSAAIAERFSRRSPKAKRYANTLAELYFEGALVSRELGRGLADQRAAIARKLWGGNSSAATPRQDLLRSAICLDRGEFDDAAANANEALRQLRDRIQRGSDETRFEVARAHELLGRVALARADLETAAFHFTEMCRAGDDTAIRHPATDLSAAHGHDTTALAKSYLALIKGIRGEIGDAVSEVAASLREAEARNGKDGRLCIPIRGNTIEVFRLAGRYPEARDLARANLSIAEKVNGPDHWFTIDLRRQLSQCLVDAGELTAAFEVVTSLFPADDGPTEAFASGQVRAQRWAALGRLLVNISQSAVPIATEPDLRALSLAQAALERADSCFPETGWSTTDRLEVLLALCEVAIRQQAEFPAREWLARARELISHEVPRKLDVRIRTKQIRIDALRASGPDLDALEAEIESLQELMTNGRDGDANLDQVANKRPEWATAKVSVNIVRAHIAVERRRLSIADPFPPHRGADLYTVFQKEMENALEPLERYIGDAPHQLVALGYGELAAFAHDFVGQRQRARNERERERTRSPFDVTNLPEVIASWRGAEGTTNRFKSIQQTTPELASTRSQSSA